MKLQAEPSRSLTERALRWLSGADRRETEAQAQAQAAQEQAAVLARAQAEADRLAREAIERTAADRARAEADARAAQVESVRVAAESDQPLICVKTATGGTFHVRREDWLAARAAKARDVSLVDWRGDPPAEGQRTRLRLATIEASVLKPLPIIAADAYIVAAGEAQAQDGPTIQM